MSSHPRYTVLDQVMGLNDHQHAKTAISLFFCSSVILLIYSTLAVSPLVNTKMPTIIIGSMCVQSKFGPLTLESDGTQGNYSHMWRYSETASAYILMSQVHLN